MSTRSYPSRWPEPWPVWASRVLRSRRRSGWRSRDPGEHRPLPGPLPSHTGSGAFDGFGVGCPGTSATVVRVLCTQEGGGVSLVEVDDECRQPSTVAAPANPSTTDVFPTPPFRLNTLTTAIAASHRDRRSGTTSFFSRQDWSAFGPRAWAKLQWRTTQSRRNAVGTRFFPVLPRGCPCCWPSSRDLHSDHRRACAGRFPRRPLQQTPATTIGPRIARTRPQSRYPFRARASTAQTFYTHLFRGFRFPARPGPSA